MPSSSLEGVCSLILFPLFATGVVIAAGVIEISGNSPPVLTPTANFFAAGIVDTGGKFATGINNTSKLVAKFVGVVDTGGKLATGVVDTGGACTLTCEYLCE